MVASLVSGWSIASAAVVGNQENISSTAGQSEGPHAAALGGEVRVVWGERSQDAVLIREKSGGGGFSGATSFRDSTKAQYQWPDVTVTPDGTTHVAYAAGNTIWHRRQANGGGWSDRHQVATDNFPNPVRIAAAPNGTLWVVWRDTDGTAVRYATSANGGSSWSTGTVARQGGNMSMPDVAVGPDNVPHVVWYLRNGSANGNTARFADWTGGGWNVGTIGGGGSYVADPVIVVGGDNVQHVAYRRQAGDNWLIQHAVRAPGQNWGGQETARQTPGNAGYPPSIAVDPRGGVHLTWSELVGRGRDVFYSAKLPGGQFGDRINVSENSGGWNSRSTVAASADGTAHIFYQRGQRGTDVDEIYYRAVNPYSSPAPAPAPAPTPPPAPNAPATGSFGFASDAFRDLWTRTDSLVQRNAVGYSWIWGPTPFTAAVREPYVQSPGQTRLVQYFDKSRMEINQPDAPRSAWYVTNGRLADELITGQLQVGDAQYEQRQPAALAVAGDPANTFPLYRDLRSVYRRPRAGDRANEVLYRAADGSVQTQPLPSANTDPSMVIAQRVAGLGIPRIFWDFMNRGGVAVENGRNAVSNPLFDWRFVMGEPLTEAYWTVVKINGRDTGVLIQAFERRVLTYTPTNPAQFQVEMGNIGRHYFEWRYGVRPR